MGTKSLKAPVLFLFGFALLVGVACPPAAAQVPGAPKELKLGLVDYLSGPAASHFGIPAVRGAQVWIEKINEEGGVGGAKLVAVISDEAGGPEKQVTEFRRLVLDEKVNAVLAYTSSADCLAVAPVAEELKVLSLFWICKTHRLFEDAKYKYVFRTSSHDAFFNIAAARFTLAVKPDVKTIMGINQDYAWGRDSWEVYKETLRKLKPDVRPVDALWPKLFVGEYSAEITKILAAKPDVVFTSFYSGDMAAFVAQGKPRRLFEQTLVVNSNFTFSRPEDWKKDLPDGMVIGFASTPWVETPPKPSPLLKEFIERYQKKFGAFPPIQAPYSGAAAVEALKVAYGKVIRQTGRWPTPGEAAKALEHLEFDTPSGLIKMAIGGGHQAIEPSFVGQRRGDTIKIQGYRAECVNPPDGAKTLDWIKQGFPGAKCP